MTSRSSPFDDVRLLPREVVMVLDVEDHLRAELLRDVLVDERVVRRGVAAHQLHRGPVFLAVGCRSSDSHARCFSSLGKSRDGPSRACCSDRTPRARAARLRVREQREVFAGFKVR